MSNTQIQVKRHELKYYINRADYEYVKHLLGELMEKDANQGSDEGYFIRSLYFDDVYDSSWEEKYAGIEKRDKYRLRIYDFEQTWVKLERKRKLGDYVQKDTGIITREEAEAMVRGDYDFMMAYENAALRSIYYDLKQKYFRPVVIVDYVRDVYMLDFNQIRITFDKHIRRERNQLDLFSAELLTEPIQRDEIIVLEVKYNDCLPSWFAKVFKFEGQTRSAISKYCMSRVGADNYWNL